MAQSLGFKFRVYLDHKCCETDQCSNTRIDSGGVKKGNNSNCSSDSNTSNSGSGHSRTVTLTLPVAVWERVITVETVTVAAPQATVAVIAESLVTTLLQEQER